MFAALRTASVARASARAFSSSASRADLAKLTLIGHLGRSPELKTTKTDKEYVVYSVATNAPLPPSEANADGRRSMRTTWHTILSFNPGSNTYLQTIPKGALVFVEAGYELREPEPDADPESPQGQRQIFLRHETIRVLKYPKSEGPEGVSDE